MQKSHFLARLATAACLGASVLGISSRAVLAAEKPVNEAQLKQVEAALPTDAPAKPQKPRKALVFTLASGFVHSSIPLGAQTFKLMGEKLGTWEAVVTSDKEMFQPDKLAQFDAVIMESTTGELFGLHRGDYGKISADEKEHNEALRKSLVDFVRAGHGLVGIHAAGDCSYDWPEYGEMMGGYFNGHPWHHVTYKIDDPSSPLTAMFPKDQPFVLDDETYTFKKEPYSREKLHVLASIDMSQMNDKDKKAENRPFDHDYALAWVHGFGKGRVFYAAHGHSENIYWNPVMLKFYLAGIQYALGDLKADDAPSASSAR
jgi:type 1 glutamine amidotransferase